MIHGRGVTLDPTMIERIEHDPAKTIEFLEAEDFEVQQDDGSGYRVAGTMAGEPIVFLVPGADELYYLWLGWWTGRHHERDRASCRGYIVSTARPGGVGMPSVRGRISGWGASGASMIVSRPVSADAQGGGVFWMLTSPRR